MFYDGVVAGRYVELRSATAEDAEFTLSIRQDPEFSKFLPRLDNTIEQQRNWIASQRNKPGDYFFVIWDKEGNRIGTISLYDVEGDVCESGRLAVRGNAFQSIEAQMLSFKFAFEELKLKEVVSYIYADNDRALRFNKQFGGVFYEPEVVNENDHPMIKAINTKEAYLEAEKKLGNMLYRERKKKNA